MPGRNGGTLNRQVRGEKAPPGAGRPLSEAILVYRERTGDEITSDVTLYAWRVELTNDFKHPSDEAAQI